jgi:hypothetical protein
MSILTDDKKRVVREQRVAYVATVYANGIWVDPYL